jgi:putative transcriptional regulator
LLASYNAKPACAKLAAIVFEDVMSSIQEQDEYLVGQLLVAMPGMQDPRFAKSVIYMCAHNAEGAMGLVVNRTFEALTFPDLLEQMDIDTTPLTNRISVHFGGPVETGRGFVLHSPDYVQDGSLVVNTGFALTATIDILKDIAAGTGPRRCMLALGYAGWGPGQLDSEIKANGWLNVAADDDLVFDDTVGTKWDRAMAKIGIDPRMLSDSAGHA